MDGWNQFKNFLIIYHLLDLECKDGDGIGGSEKNTGQKFASMDECIAFVKKEHPTANGATLETSCSECKCFAEFDMTDWKDNSKYKSCLFKQKEEDPKPGTHI